MQASFIFLGIIALTWIMKCKLTMIREDLKESQQEYLKKFRKRAKVIISGSSWMIHVKVDGPRKSKSMFAQD